VSFLIFGMIVIMCIQMGVFNALLAAQNSTQFKRVFTADVVMTSLFYGIYFLLDAVMIVKQWNLACAIEAAVKPLTCRPQTERQKFAIHLCIVVTFVAEIAGINFYVLVERDSVKNVA